MNRGSWGKVRAFFDLTTQDGFTIKGFKLIEGINGLFVSMPSQKGNDDEYYDTVWVESKQLREDLSTLAITEYQNPSTDDANSIQSEPEAVGDNIKEPTEDASPKEDVSSPAFSDDDIPF
jgi:stage V sporulation protein G